MKTKSEFSYARLQGFIPPHLCDALCHVFDKSKQTAAFGKDIGFAREATGIPEFDLFLDICTPRFEAIVGEEIVPTYAFARNYFIGSKLIRHTDRPSCVYTATLTLRDSSKLGWPIYLETPDRELKVVNKAGDLLIFRGRELPHRRMSLLDGECLQLFLHYVPKQLDYEPLFFDGRESLECGVHDIGFRKHDAVSMLDEFVNYLSTRGHQFT